MAEYREYDGPSGTICSCKPIELIVETDVDQNEWNNINEFFSERQHKRVLEYRGGSLKRCKHQFTDIIIPHDCEGTPPIPKSVLLGARVIDIQCAKSFTGDLQLPVTLERFSSVHADPVLFKRLLTLPWLEYVSLHLRSAWPLPSGYNIEYVDDVDGDFVFANDLDSQSVVRYANNIEHLQLYIDHEDAITTAKYIIKVLESGLDTIEVYTRCPLDEEFLNDLYNMENVITLTVKKLY